MRTTPIHCTALAAALFVGILPAGAAPEGVTPTWEAHALRSIEAQEYEFRATDDGRWSAPNRAHGLRAFVGESGFELVPRVEGAERFRIGLALRGWGRGSALGPVGPGALALAGKRLELRRPAGITEWWVNDSRGIEHGFDLSTPPEGEAEEVALEMALEGGLAFGGGTTTVEFKDPAGNPAVRYGGLMVRDALGRELNSRFELAPGVVRIVFDDHGAAYPITVDPLATAASWSFEGGQESARLGNSVSTAGDVNGDGYSDVLVSAYVFDGGVVDGGKIWVFHGGPNGVTSPSAWEASGDQDGGNLGCWVTGLGDVNGDGYDDIAAGAWQYDTGGIPGRGRVYVWHGGPGGLSNTPARILDGVQTDENFGVRVAGADVNGDGFRDLLVTSYQYDTRLFVNFWVYDAGRVLVYLGGPSGIGTSPWWEYRAESEQGRMATLAGLGDVNGDGYDDFATAAPFDDIAGTDTGTVYVFHGGPSAPALIRTWNGSQLGGALGFSVAGGDLDGDGYSELVVGAALWDSSGPTPDDGRVFAYRGGSGGVSSTPFWEFGSGAAYSQFGWVLSTVDVNADGRADLLVGSDVWDAPGGLTDAGRAWLFQSTASGPAANPTWTYSSGQPFAYSGSAVAAAGDVNGDGFGDVVIGDYGWDGGYWDDGRVLTFHGSSTGPQPSYALQITPNQGFAEYGYSVASAGDVNADGFSDVIVGAWLYDDGNADEGGAFLYLGSAQGLSGSPAWTGGSNQDGGHFGYAVASAGDVNGDGYDDVVVGAKDVDSPEVNEGVVYVYHGQPGGLTAGAVAVIQSNQSGAQLGWSVASAGDVNGDGYSEVAINAILWDSASVSDTGRVWLCYGSGAGVQQPCAWAADGSQIAENFGYSVASAGDVNRDGYSDLIVGAPNFDQTYSNEGRALIYLGGPGGLASSAAWSRVGNNAGFLGGVQYGISVASAGDVNGDGYADWLVGANGAENGQTDEGRVALYYGSSSIAGANPGWYGESDQAFAYYGVSVASAGDVNGDGFGDVVIGANAWDEGGGSNDGKAWLYLGSVSGLGSSPAWTRAGYHSGAAFGFSVASAGDVDGDGFSDLIVGSRYENGGGANIARGSAYLFYGNGGSGLSRAPGQRYLGNEFRPIATLGTSDQAGFYVRVLGRTPAGRGQVSAQVEAKPLATPFNGVGLVNSARVLTSAPGSAGSFSELRFPMAGLSGETAYKWRCRIRTQNPSFPWTPWFSIPGNTTTLTDLRTACAQSTWYRDADGDGYGNPADSYVSCLQLIGYVGNGLDCNDASAAAYPGAPEVCDGIDNDCDLAVDEGIAPVIVTGLVGNKLSSGGTAQWTWSAVSGATYDMIWGYLEGLSYSLRATGGEYAASTVNCLVNDAATNSVQEAMVPGVPGVAFWYLVRANRCGGTYESGSARQVGLRDPEIAASGVACP